MLTQRTGSSAVGKLIRRAGWLTIAQYAAALIGLANTVMVSRLLGPEQFGLVALTLSYTTLMWGVVSFKAASVTTRYIAGYHAGGQTRELGAVCRLGYAIDLVTALVVTALVCASAGPFAEGFLGKAFLAPYIILSALAMPLYALTGTSRTVLLSFDQVRTASAFIVLEKLAILVCTGLSLLSFGASFEQVVAAQAGSQALIGAAMLAWTLRALRRRQVRVGSAAIRDVSHIFADLKGLFAWNYLHTTVSSAVEQLPVLLLGRYESAAAAGIFKIATTLAVTFGYAEASLRRLVYLEFSRQRISMSGRELLLFSSGLGRRIGPALAGLTVVAVVAVYGLVPLLFGPRYAASVAPAQVLMVAAGVSGFFFWVEAYYFAMGALRRWTLQFVVVSVVTAACMLALALHSHGTTAVLLLAITAAAARVAFVLVSVRGASKVHGGQASAV